MFRFFLETRMVYCIIHQWVFDTRDAAILFSCAGVAELADAPDLGSGEATREGSSPFARTIKDFFFDSNLPGSSYIPSSS